MHVRCFTRIVIVLDRQTREDGNPPSVGTVFTVSGVQNDKTSGDATSTTFLMGADPFINLENRGRFSIVYNKKFVTDGDDPVKAISSTMETIKLNKILTFQTGGKHAISNAYYMFVFQEVPNAPNVYGIVNSSFARPGIKLQTRLAFTG